MKPAYIIIQSTTSVEPNKLIVYISIPEDTQVGVMHIRLSLPCPHVAYIYTHSHTMKRERFAVVEPPVGLCEQLSIWTKNLVYLLVSLDNLTYSILVPLKSNIFYMILYVKATNHNVSPLLEINQFIPQIYPCT